MKKVFSLRNILALVILIVGLGFLFYDQIEQFAVNQFTNYYLNHTDAATIKRNAAAKGEFDFDKVKPIGMANVTHAAVAQPAVLGKLAIPTAQMYLPILKGLSDGNLATGAGTMKATQQMGKGNYALAGHYMTDNGPLFSNLIKISVGDNIYITDLQQIYVYRVSSIQTVYRNQVHWIDNIAHKKLITLVTCASPQVNEANRLIVRGELLQSFKATKDQLSIFNH